MRGAVHTCCDDRESARPGVLSRINVVSHWLFEGSNSALNLAIRLMVVLGRYPDLDTKGLHHLRPKLKGKARVLVKNNADRHAMDIEDGIIEFLKDFLRGGAVLTWDEMCVGGETVHNDHDGCVAIRLVKGTGKVNR